MSNMKINIGGKGFIACSAAFDISKGCSVGCSGCYAKAITCNPNFDIPQYKGFNKDEFNKSAISAFKKGLRFVRAGKSSDPFGEGYSEKLLSAQEICSKTGLKVVYITKLATYNEQFSKMLKESDSSIHISLGMISKNSLSEFQRIDTYKKFKKDNVRAKVRVVEDVTSGMSEIYKSIPRKDIIVTPMRYRGEKLINLYGVKIENYSHFNGYYKPKFIHKDWEGLDFCGEIGDKDSYQAFCSKCGYGD